MLCVPPAAAQDRDPTVRQKLLELAYALGESHALRLVCEPEDQYWRARMRRLIELERPDQAFADVLAKRFNAGFQVRESQFPACDARVGAEAAAAARRGQALADALSRIR